LLKSVNKLRIRLKGNKNKGQF